MYEKEDTYKHFTVSGGKEDAIKYGKNHPTTLINLYKAAKSCLGDDGKGCDCNKDEALKILNK